MDCTTFIERFSDYRDGTASEAETRAADGHLDRCEGCRAYQRVVERGLAVLRGEGEVEVPEDFHSRLQHRLFHVDDEAALLSQAGSSASAMAVLGIALLLTAVAWSPMLRPSNREVELPAIVVSRPAPRAVGLRPANAFPYARPASAVRSSDLFGNGPTLLYEHSALSQRYRKAAVPVRASLEASH